MFTCLLSWQTKSFAKFSLNFRRRSCAWWWIQPYSRRAVWTRASPCPRWWSLSANSFPKIRIRNRLHFSHSMRHWSSTLTCFTGHLDSILRPFLFNVSIRNLCTGSRSGFIATSHKFSLLLLSSGQYSSFCALRRDSTLVIYGDWSKKSAQIFHIIHSTNARWASVRRVFLHRYCPPYPPEDRPSNPPMGSHPCYFSKSLPFWDSRCSRHSRLWRKSQSANWKAHGTVWMRVRLDANGCSRSTEPRSGTHFFHFRWRRCCDHIDQLQCTEYD